LDTSSDLIIFDAETNTILKPAKISTEKNFETFPCWSPDGTFLYFCSAKALPQDKYDQIRYDLLRMLSIRLQLNLEKLIQSFPQLALERVCHSQKFHRMGNT
jgi:hypothetical protein